VRLRVVVEGPLPGVRLAVQQGRDGLLAPEAASGGEVAFAWDAPVTDGPDGLRVRGPEIQGPPGGRFVYVNAGVRAGDLGSRYERRAKLPLATLAPALLARALAEPGAVLEARVAGSARDGGPLCATVPLLGGGWRLAGTGER
jgi:hypothetical protein